MLSCVTTAMNSKNLYTSLKIFNPSIMYLKYEYFQRMLQGLYFK